MYTPHPHARTLQQVELFEGGSPSKLEPKTHYTSTFHAKTMHPRPPHAANIDMGRSETEWALTDKIGPTSFSTSGRMPQPGIVYQRHALPIRTVGLYKLTHSLKGARFQPLNL
jgi:hypothetical protein